MKIFYRCVGVCLLLLSTGSATQAAIITQSVTGSLIGTQLLPQLDPGWGSLTAVSFQLISAVSGTVSATGTPVTIPFIGTTCLPATFVALSTVVGANLNLSSVGTTTVNLSPPGCSATRNFNQTRNTGPSAGLGPLSSYVGFGTLPFNFAVTAPGATLSNVDWSGTLSVTYTFTTPEPSTWMMTASAVLGMLLLRQRLTRRAPAAAVQVTSAK